MPSYASEAIESIEQYFEPYVQQIVRRATQPDLPPVEEVPSPVEEVVPAWHRSCYDCGGHFPPAEVTSIGRAFYCKARCLDRHVKACAGCGTRLVRETPSNDSPYVQVVRTGLLRACPYEWFCSSCTGEDDFARVEMGTRPNAKVWACTHCSVFFSLTVEARTASSTNPRLLCETCYARIIEQTMVRMNYSVNVLKHLSAFPQPPDKLQFGIELEVQTQHDINPQVRIIMQAMPDFAICKSDSSLERDDQNGFEIVTVPATMEEHKREWQKFFELKSLKLYSWKTGHCGMHVHITRAALTPLQIGKMLMFVNSPYNQGLIADIAGRGSSHYTRIYEKKITQGLSGPLSIDGATSRNPYSPKQALIQRLAESSSRQALNHDHRYEAVNLINPNTVEIRIFRGTMKPESFFKNLEFVHALVKFTKDAGNNQLLSGDFITWLKDNRREYPNLMAFLVMKKVIAEYKNPDPSVVDPLWRKDSPNRTKMVSLRTQALQASKKTSQAVFNNL